MTHTTLHIFAASLDYRSYQRCGCPTNLSMTCYIKKLALLCAVLATGVDAFTPAASSLASPTRTTSARKSFSPTALNERQWNFNDGRGPFGLKKNAEIWNGRVAQVCFVVVFLQELIQGKGVIQGISEGDPINLALAGVTFVSMAGLTVFLALKGTDDYVEIQLSKEE